MEEEDGPKPMFKPQETEMPSGEKWEMLESSLKIFMQNNIPIESRSELKKREEVMAELKRIFQQWVYEVCLKKEKMNEEQARAAGGKLYTSGSYRLRVHEPGADIDSVGVAPRMCGRAEFFTSLKESLLNHADVENLRAIDTAAVPILTFDMRGVNIDLLFAQLPMNTVPESTDIDNDAILNAVDSASEKSLNGPRVTNLIYKLVAHNYDSFLAVLRVVRVWAKRRGLYSNKSGYLGGVNFNILVGIICQMFPKATPAYMLNQFFQIFAHWDWDTMPAMLTKPLDISRTLDQQFEVWTIHQLQINKRNNLMPIITPAYPAMNSALSVNPWTFQIIVNEFQRAANICDAIKQDHFFQNNISSGARRLYLPRLAKTWNKLIQPTEFFAKYDHYLALRILGGAEVGGAERESTGCPENKDADQFEEFEDFKGFISSRLRKFVEKIGALPFSVVHLFPKEFPEDNAERRHATRYYFGLITDEARLKEGEKLVLTHVWTSFWLDEVVRNKAIPQHLDLKLDYLRWHQLPHQLFDGNRNHVRKARQAILKNNQNNQDLQTDLQTDKTENQSDRVKKHRTTGLFLTPDLIIVGDTIPISLHNLPIDLPKLSSSLVSWPPLQTNKTHLTISRLATFSFEQYTSLAQTTGDYSHLPINPDTDEPIVAEFDTFIDGPEAKKLKTQHPTFNQILDELPTTTPTLLQSNAYHLEHTAVPPPTSKITTLSHKPEPMAIDHAVFRKKRSHLLVEFFFSCLSFFFIVVVVVLCCRRAGLLS